MIGISAAMLAGCLSYSPNEIPLSNRNVRNENLAALESGPPPPAPIRFAVVGDVHDWYDATWHAVRLLNGIEGLAFVVQMGDFTDIGRSYEYEQMTEEFEALDVPWFVVLGNHDLLSNGGKIFDHLFGPRNSDFTYARTRFVFVDTNSREYGFGSGVPDVGWLGSRLAPSPDHDRVVVFSHVPPSSSDFDPALRDAFVSTIEGAGVALCVHGHEHSYQAGSYGSVPYVIVDAVVRRTILLVEELPTGGFDFRRISF